VIPAAPDPACGKSRREGNYRMAADDAEPLMSQSRVNLLATS